MFQLQLDGIELKKIYTLNPLAPEFVPRKYKEMVVLPATKVEPATLPKDVGATTNIVTQIVPPVVSPFPIQDYRYFPPILYPQQARPFLFPLVPPAVAQLPQLTNGFTQPIRVVNPPMVVSSRQIVPQPISLPKTVQVTTVANTPVQNDLISQTNKNQSSNKLIQFMNNVHFPEANVLNDCINLLPQNMSLADMLLQPMIMQERWYNYLKETTGLEAAEKFKYLLHTTNQKGMKVMDKNIFERSTPQSCESPTFSWFDSPTNQINFNKPVYMQENFSETNNVSQNGLLAKQDPVRTLPNGINHTMSEVELQRHINEEFANLHTNSSDVNEAFRALTIKNEPHNALHINGGNNINGPRFSKYFH